MMISQIIRKPVLILILLYPFTCMNGQLKQMDAKLDSIFGQYNLKEKPGVSIAILEKNKPVYFRSYGQANLEYQIKNTPNTLFNATDLAKQFTIFSILLLQDQDKLSIHDNVKKFLPSLKEWPFEITLKHLMEQTSGLKDVMDLKQWTGYENGDLITKEEILEMMAKQKYLNYPAGSKFGYNRSGFVLLTEIIAKVSGQSFSSFVDEYIFTPLGMNNSVFVSSHDELIKNRSYSYTTVDNGYVKIANNASFLGGTNLFTTVSDFAKWLQNMTNQHIGKSSFYTYLQTKVKLPDGQSSNYTAGIFKEDSQGYWRIHLEGFDHGYTGYMMYLPEQDFSLVYFSNNDNFPIDDINPKLWDWFNSDYKIAPVETGLAQSVKLINKPATALKAYTGNYLFEDNYNHRKIELINDTLFYIRGENNRSAMLPIEEKHSFKMIYPGNDNIRVLFKDQGRFLEFRVIQPGPEHDYISVGRKFLEINELPMDIGGSFRNELMDHTITIHNTNENIYLHIENSSMLLNQIGKNEFIPKSNPKVKFVKLQRDDEQKVIGISLSGDRIRNLYYKRINQ